jgi:hypothetical protein
MYEFHEKMRFLWSSELKMNVVHVYDVVRALSTVASLSRVFTKKTESISIRIQTANCPWEYSNIRAILNL